MTAQRTIQPIRGEIYLVNFDPTIGSEISKTRPALAIGWVSILSCNHSG
jgi:mRNA interferase MazF